MYTMVEDFERPDPNLVRALAKFPPAILSQALGRPNTLHTLQSLYRLVRLAGTALPVQVAPGDNLMVHLALTVAQPGDILVVDTGGSTGAACFTELMARDALSRGVQGLVTDGAVRDGRTYGDLKFPVFAAATSPCSPQSRAGGSVGLPVALGGCVVTAGDVVVADDDGVVIIPRAEARAVQAMAEAMLEREATLRVRLAAGEHLFDLLGLQAALDCMICRQPQGKASEEDPLRDSIRSVGKATPRVLKAV